MNICALEATGIVTLREPGPSDLHVPRACLSLAEEGSPVSAADLVFERHWGAGSGKRYAVVAPDVPVSSFLFKGLSLALGSLTAQVRLPRDVDWRLVVELRLSNRSGDGSVVFLSHGTVEILGGGMGCNLALSWGEPILEFPTSAGELRLFQIELDAALELTGSSEPYQGSAVMCGVSFVNGVGALIIRPLEPVELRGSEAGEP
jgi:hypothetical protein